jgi:rhodanese-related sulfurtransferase
MFTAVARFGFVAILLVAWRPPRLPAQEQTTARPSNVFRAVLDEKSPRTPEISTEELRSILASGAAILLDTRPHLEWAISHIPGAHNVAPKPGVPMSQYTSDVSEVGRLVALDKTRPLVLYCNGPFCGKSKRVSEDLLAAGYTNVRRYQLGAPVWRALGGVMVTELDGLHYTLEKDVIRFIAEHVRSNVRERPKRSDHRCARSRRVCGGDLAQRSESSTEQSAGRERRRRDQGREGRRSSTDGRP